MLIPMLAGGLILFIVISGYFIFTNRQNAIPVNQNKSNQGNIVVKNGECKLGDREICRYGEALINSNFYQKGFSAQSTFTDKDGKKTASDIKIAGQNKMQMISYQDGKETANIIFINKVMYSKDYSDNSWIKYETPQISGSQPNQYDIEEMKVEMKQVLEEESDKYTFKKIGKEACPPLNCFKYQQIINDMPDLIQYIYFDDKQYLMRKTRTEQKDGTVTEMVFDYKTKVTINEPSPVKTMDLQKYIQPTGTNSQIDQKTIDEFQKQLEEQLKNSGN